MTLQENRPNQKQDWFLITIVASILLLVAVTLILVFLNPEQRDYRDEGQPEHVAYNYFLAIQIGEYDKAYQYLSTDLENYPADAGQFFDELQNSWNCSADSLQQSRFEILQTDLFDDRANISIEETIFTNSRGIFDSGSYTQQHNVRLIESVDGWRITKSDKCWDPTWDTTPKEN